MDPLTPTTTCTITTTSTSSSVSSNPALLVAPRRATQHPLLQHSWFQRSAHVVRDSPESGKLYIRRCKILELDLWDGEVRINVEFNEEGCYKSTRVCPLALVATQKSYCSRVAGCVSENDEDEAPHPVAPAKKLCQLECTNMHVLTKEQRKQLAWMIRQVNQQLELLDRIPDVNRVFDYDIPL